MERRRFPIEDIHIGDNRRKPDMKKVEEIAKSIRDVGIMNPPAVCIRDNVVMVDGEICDAVPVLIYGRHRLLALLENGEDSVECVVHDVDEDDARLMEIDENLARSELSPAEEAQCVRERQVIWERKYGSAKAIGGRASAVSQGKEVATENFSVAFTKDTAAASGKNERTVRMAAQRGRELGPDITRIAGTSLDKGVEMDALIKLPEPVRKELIERAAAGEAVSARANNQPAPAHDADLEAAVAILDKYGEDDMPFLLPHLKPRVAAAIRELMAA